MCACIAKSGSSRMVLIFKNHLFLSLPVKKLRDLLLYSDMPVFSSLSLLFFFFKIILLCLFPLYRLLLSLSSFLLLFFIHIYSTYDYIKMFCSLICMNNSYFSFSSYSLASSFFLEIYFLLHFSAWTLQDISQRIGGNLEFSVGSFEHFSLQIKDI